MSDGVGGDQAIRRKLEQIVQRAPDVPTISAVVSKVVQLASDDQKNASDVAEIISKEPALAVKLLRLVNSAVYGQRTEIISLNQAVVVLGSRAVCNVALSFAVLNVFATQDQGGFSYRIFWENSLRRAVVARLLAVRTRHPFADEAFTAGLMLDIGSLIILKYLPEEAAQVWTAVREGKPQHEVEREILGTDHAKVGGLLLRRWKLPELLVHVMEHHHTASSKGLTKEEEAIWQLVVLGDLAADLYGKTDRARDLAALYERAQAWYGLAPTVVNQFLEETSNEVAAAAQLLGLDIDSQVSYAEILQQATQELARINLTYDQMNRELQRSFEHARQLASNLEESNKKLQDLAFIDPLTSCYNRRFFNDQLVKELSRARRYNRPFTLILIDIDHFKNFNDRHGHPVGDMVLQELVNRLRVELRETDSLARYGGEEFAVLCVEADEQGGLLLAERLRRRVERLPLKLFDYEFPVTISLGGATFHPQGAVADEIALITAADQALYQSKSGGRNRSTWWSPKSA